MIYNVHDKPPFGKLILFSIQMVLSVFVATVLIANICGTSVSGALVGAGLSTLIYVAITKGCSPMFLSSSGAFVAAIIFALSMGGYTGVLIGGVTACVVYCILGLIFTRIPYQSIYKIFPRSLIGAVTCVIGINLMPFCLSYVQINGETNMWGVGIALVTMLVIALVSHYAKGIFKILPFLVGIIAGYAIAVVLTLCGVYKIIDFSVFNNLTFFSMPDFAFNHWGSIDVAAVVPIVIMFVAYTVSACMEALSDHAALGGIIGVDLYQNPGLSRIFIGEGVANLLGTAVGGLNICSYGESVADTGFSRVSSIYVIITAAIMLGLLGFIMPVQAFIASIPSCVFCGAAFILYGFIACSGIKMLQKVNLDEQKHLVIVSAVLSLGISGVVAGGEVINFSATALALIAGVVLNIILKEKAE